MFVQTVFDLVGNTPLVALRRISQGLNGVSLFAKAEFLNPSGSVKDRAVKALILSGIEQGRLVGGKTIVDATS
uniref:pyridoxal-phosphate dependent enzyme n=1 Tax=Treponema endosymbiont of Eucomonympha sp. TaxID=1580831 RepID=UPI001EE7168C